MADDPRYRSQRFDPYAPDRPSRPASGSQDDPLAELARLIGRDEAFIAASREGARPAPRDPQRGPDSSTSTPNWLTRTGQRSSHERGGAGTYEAETGRRDPGYFSDPELETGHRSRQAPARSDAGPEADDIRAVLGDVPVAIVPNGVDAAEFQTLPTDAGRWLRRPLQLLDLRCLIAVCADAERHRERRRGG